MAHKEQLIAAKKNIAWDFKPQFQRVKPLFENALVVGNLETVFAGEEHGFAEFPMFNTPDEFADALSDLGLSVVTLANNHILDRKPSGAARTIRVLERSGIKWTGLGHDGTGSNEALVLEHGGLRWAFVNYTYGSNAPVPSFDDTRGVHLNVISDEAIRQGLLNARAARPDIIVACFHWGNEYQFVPTKRQRAVAALSICEGADIVIGTHPHVLQPLEIASSEHGYGLVAYSLGNFVSNQRKLPQERSLILAVDVQKTGGKAARISRVSVAPTRISVTRPLGGSLIEVVYAGESARFNHEGLPTSELKKVQQAGAAVLEFVGAATSPDKEGFYTLWSADFPELLPKGNRKTPK
ncbi:MAG: CapA family protein, partial [Desulfovibrio sp.]|jgi:poly-gamma-glutamate synthesis protein (capsule biosynthesis protein)|nr:CapA family protein [Desulfovibrio sp.]